MVAPRRAGGQTAPMGQRRQHPARRGGAGRARLVGSLLVPALLIAACGAGGSPSGTGSPTAGSPTAATAAISTVAPGSSAPSTPARPSGSLTVSGSVQGSGSVQADGPTTLTGTVTEGVESRCVLLVDDSGATLANLMGWDLQAHPFGSTVEVTGSFEEGLMTTCQQGRPFVVTSVVAR